MSQTFQTCCCSLSALQSTLNKYWKIGQLFFKLKSFYRQGCIICINRTKDQHVRDMNTFFNGWKGFELKKNKKKPVNTLVKTFIYYYDHDTVTSLLHKNGLRQVARRGSSDQPKRISKKKKKKKRMKKKQTNKKQNKTWSNSFD